MDVVGGELGGGGGQVQGEGQGGEDQAGDGDADDLGDDQGAAPGGDEHGRDDRLVPVLAAGGDDAQHEHGHAADDTGLEHLVGAGRRAEGLSAVLARRHRSGDDAYHGEAGRRGQGDKEGAGGGELAGLRAG